VQKARNFGQLAHHRPVEGVSRLRSMKAYFDDGTVAADTKRLTHKFDWIIRHSRPPSPSERTPIAAPE
jgi:hypothetical protein